MTVKQVDAKLDAVWHDNLIPFQKADIFTITKALERFYDVKIILSPDIQTGKNLLRCTEKEIEYRVSVKIIAKLYTY